MAAHARHALTVVGLGEALWDVLPAGRQLGGAPLNVACHVEALLGPAAGRGVVASGVGRDALGDEVARQLAARGMTADLLQRDGQHATSTVEVALRNGQPTYTFAPDIAWDHLQFTDQWAELAGTCAAVCFGTLAQRSPPSRQTIWQFLDAAGGAVRLFDVNLRQGFYDRESIVEGCRRATLVKLNEHELDVVAAYLDLPAAAIDVRLAELRQRCDLDAVIYTRGERGTRLVLADETIDPPVAHYRPAAEADCVGAGDACSAGILAGWVLGLSRRATADLANRLGAFVASQPGATPRLPLEISSGIG